MRFPEVRQGFGKLVELEASVDEPSEFEFGLDLILDGLERLRDTA
jgi:hypothetical protein